MDAPGGRRASGSALGHQHGGAPHGHRNELVTGEIDPGGEHTQYFVQYEEASSEFCRDQAGDRGPLLALTVSLSIRTDGWGSRDGWGPPHSTKPQPLPFNKNDYEYHAVSVELPGLSPRSEYCAELVAFNDSGRASGSEVEFIAGAPSVINSRLSPALDALQAEIDPAGQASTYQVLYAPIASEWCKSEGEEGTPAKLGAPTPLGFSDSSYHPVSVPLMGLVAGAEYCGAIAAENGSGGALGLQLTFSLGPTVESLSPAAGPTSGGSTVTIRGVNLARASAVHFGTAAAAIQSDEADKLVVSAPAHEVANVDVTVTTPAGTSATNGADLFTYEAPSSPGTQSGGGGGPGTGPNNTPTGGGGGSGPALGESTEVGVVSGTVTAHVPGSTSFAPFTGGTIPDGSEIDATHGVVIVTVKTPQGTTVSAEVFGGRFLVRQDKDGETHFILTLPLTGCARTKLPRGAAAARVQGRLKKPRSRYLWVSEKGGRWGTNGRYVSTSVEGTRWLTLDECKRSLVLVAEGKVKVRNLVTRHTKTLTAGGRYVAHARRPKHKRHG